MNPQLENIDNNAISLQFTLTGVNLSLANALRRTILSDIPLVVFRTTPNTRNKCTIFTNTSRLNNEVIKQRLSCIPIHIKLEDPNDIRNLVMEVNVKNETDNILFVTSGDFIIKNKNDGKKIPDEEIRKIFPKDPLTNDYIDFVRLRPQITDELQGEKIHLICEFDNGTAKEDGMFNAVSTCSYGFTPDPVAQESELTKQKQKWMDEGKTEEEILFEEQNWKLLDAKRIYKKDSYDFIVESVGIYDNVEIVDLSCKILMKQLLDLGNIIEQDDKLVEIKSAQSTMANSYDIILHNHDYTIGKILEYFLYTKYYETKTMTYCGFKKLHPHDTFCLIRVAYTETTAISGLKGHLQDCIISGIHVYEQLSKDLQRIKK